jgi:hypothetical protein
MKKKPNVLFLLTDDQRYGTIHALGNDEIQTPNMDRLVRMGTSFVNAHIPGGTASAVCMPSRAMINSGKTLFHLEDCGRNIPTDHITMGQNFLANGLGDNGRFEIWKTGIDQFLAHPIFGAGFYDNGITAEEILEWNLQIYPNLYHNTVIQMLGAAGIVGLAAYLWHRFCTVKLALTRPTLEKTMLALGILALVLFGMLDVLFFITYPLLYYALMLAFMEHGE